MVVPGFFPENSTCQFCEHVVFSRRAGLLRQWRRPRRIASSPDEWFDRADGFAAAYLVHLNRRWELIPGRPMAAWQLASDHWLVCLKRARNVESWEASWEVGDQNAPDQRIWRVNYRTVDLPLPVDVAHVSNDRLRQQLSACLRDLEDFSFQQDLQGFAHGFRAARDCLSSDDPLSAVYHRDLAPPDVLDPSAIRLLSACQLAWVFGGMGSWNDLAFNGAVQETYRAVSKRLYDMLTTTICSVVNQSAAHPWHHAG